MVRGPKIYLIIVSNHSIICITLRQMHTQQLNPLVFFSVFAIFRACKRMSHMYILTLPISIKTIL